MGRVFKTNTHKTSKQLFMFNLCSNDVYFLTS